MEQKRRHVEGQQGQEVNGKGEEMKGKRCEGTRPCVGLESMLKGSRTGEEEIQLKDWTGMRHEIGHDRTRLSQP